MLRFLTLPLLAAACACALPGTGHAASCDGYNYAGLASDTTGFGVRASIRPTRTPTVEGGHVAGWIGVGGEGLGPGGSDEWLQAGISSVPGSGLSLYYELTLPGRQSRYVMLKGHLPAGRTYQVAVVEATARPNWWSVRVDGARLTQPIHLPGSHGAWRPDATAEDWSGDTGGACNSFGFRFASVQVAASPGGSWQPLSGTPLTAPGLLTLRRSADGFLARSVN